MANIDLGSAHYVLQMYKDGELDQDALARWDSNFGVNVINDSRRAVTIGEAASRARFYAFLAMIVMIPVTGYLYVYLLIPPVTSNLLLDLTLLTSLIGIAAYGRYRYSVRGVARPSAEELESIWRLADHLDMLKLHKKYRDYDDMLGARTKSS